MSQDEQRPRRLPRGESDGDKEIREGERWLRGDRTSASLTITAIYTPRMHWFHYLYVTVWEAMCCIGLFSLGNLMLCDFAYGFNTEHLSNGVTVFSEGDEAKGMLLVRSEIFPTTVRLKGEQRRTKPRWLLRLEDK